MKSILIFLAFSIFTISIHAQDCFRHRVSTADKALKQGNYDMALDYYNQAKDCVDAPKNLSFLNKKIVNAKAAKRKGKKPKCSSLSLGNTSLTFDVSGKIPQIVQITGANWRVKTSPFWVTCEKIKNGLSIYCNDNFDSRIRQDFIEIVGCGNQKGKIFVSQSKKKETISLSASSLSISYQGGSFKATVTTDAQNYNVTSDAYWLSVQKDGHEIYMSADKNDGKVERHASVSVFTDSGSSDFLSVYQGYNERAPFFRAIAFRGGSNIEGAIQFNLRRGFLDLGFGKWTNCDGLGFTGTYNALISDGRNWNWYLGCGAGLANATDYEWIGALVGVLELEWITLDPLGITIDYRPVVGISSGKEYYTDYLNFNIGIRLYLDGLNHR